jgi:hypothetical protein
VCGAVIEREEEMSKMNRSMSPQQGDRRSDGSTIKNVMKREEKDT